MKRTSLDREWQFSTSDADFFSLLRPGNAVVHLPHDFTIGTRVAPDAPGGKNVGFFKGGIGTYVKSLEVPLEWKEECVILACDGAYMNAEVSVNGHLVALHHYGYTPFQADLRPFLTFGKPNRLVITVNNSAPDNARWYSGSGLYRHVDLLRGPMIHLAPFPIYALTEKIENGTATVTVEITVQNDSPREEKVPVRVVLSLEGVEESVGESGFFLDIPARSRAVGKTAISVNNAQIWDLDAPRLYTVQATIGEEASMDEETALFGIRTISVDSLHGFRLNGKTLKLKGGCVHHDNGLLGAASFYDSEYRKMKLHKDHGFNAIRCAHNPPSRDMLEACDRLGLLVIDEAFDVWRMKKNTNDYHLYFDQDWKADMTAFMTRDRNHPCIAMWSTGNEIVERNGLATGYELAAELAAYARTLDRTRPITSAIPTPFNGLDDDRMMKVMMSWRDLVASGQGMQNLSSPYTHAIFKEITEKFAQPLDVVSYNYLDDRYERDGNDNPSRVFCGTESYPKMIDVIWDRVERFPFVIGDFTWTSYDYLGEAGLGIQIYQDPDSKDGSAPTFGGPAVPFPWRLAYCADFDLCGFDRAQLHFRKIVWGSPETYITVHNPANRGKIEHLGRWGWTESDHHWAFTGQEGLLTTVEVFSAADEVELFVNGTSCGTRAGGKAHRFRTCFEVQYEPGILLAISRVNGVEISRQTLVSPGKPAGLQITLEKDEVRSGGQALSFATVEVVDSEGQCVPLNDRKAFASVTGAGVLAAFGNGRPATEENYTSGEFTSFEGRWQAIVRSGFQAGSAVLTVRSDGLGETLAVIQVR